MDHHHLSLDDIYKKGSWSRLCVLAGLKEDFSDPDEQVLSKGLRRFCHHNDPGQLEQLLSMLKGELGEVSLDAMEPGMKQLLTLFCFSIWSNTPPEKTLSSNLSRLKSNGMLMTEVCGLMALLMERTDTLVYPSGLPFACPYYFLGPANYVRHSGSQPMSIVWRLKYPMPARLTRTTRRLAVA